MRTSQEVLRRFCPFARKKLMAKPINNYMGLIDFEMAMDDTISEWNKQFKNVGEVQNAYNYFLKNRVYHADRIELTDRFFDSLEASSKSNLTRGKI